MNQTEMKLALNDGLLLLKPLLESACDPIVAMNAANAVQKHYRSAITRAMKCPVCEDSACETNSKDCGK